MKLNIVNLVSLFITIIIIGSVYYQWLNGKKKDKIIEGFELDSNQFGQSVSLFDYLLNTYKFDENMNKRIEALDKQFKEEGTVKKSDYEELLKDVRKIISDEHDPEKGAFILKQQVQERQLNDINKELDDLNGKIDTSQYKDQIDRISSVKSINSGMNLNVNQLDHDQVQSLNQNEKELLFDGTPLMVYLNQGCLTYNADGKYTVKYCEKQNPNQYLILKDIKNRDQLNKLINDPEQHVNQKTDLENVYPFKVITPYQNQKACLQLDSQGVSVEDCRGLSSNNNQKWVQSSVPRTC